MKYIILLIPIENIGVQFVQTFSCFLPFSLIFFIFLISYKKIKLTTSCKILLFLIFWLLITTLINILATSELNNSFIRAISGLILGISVYFSLRYIFYVYSPHSIAKVIFFSYVMVLFFSLLDLFLTFHNRLRLFASYTEPAHLATDLVLIYFPSFLIFQKYYSMWEKKFFFYGIMCMLLLSFSATGFLKLFVFFITIMFYNILRAKIQIWQVKIIVGMVIFVFLIFYLFPENYSFLMINAMQSSIFRGYEYMPISFTDRFSFWILLFNFKYISLYDLNTSTLFHILIGKGLGSDLYYLSFLPSVVVNQILSVKGFTSYISSFVGRIFAYSGIIGLFLLVSYFTSLFSMINKNKFLNINEKIILKSVLITLFFSMTFDLAPFQTIALWFFPSYIDALYMKNIYTKNGK